MEDFNTPNIVNLIQLHWKKFTIIAISSIIISSFLSSPLFIKPTYLSKAIVYPTNLSEFSKESGTEQLLQFINSEEVKQNLTKQFNLYKVYGIDTTELGAFSKFDTYYHENINATATMYESVEINVIDESPKLAQQMANTLIEETNKVISKTKKEKNGEYLKSYKNQLLITETEIDSIESQLKIYRINYGIFDFKAQAKAMSKKNGFNDDDKLVLKSLKEVGGKYTILQEKLKTELKNYKYLKLEYDKNLLNFNSNLSFSTIVSKANLPDKKYAPKRLIIVLCFTLSVLLVALIFIMINKKKQNNVSKN